MSTKPSRVFLGKVKKKMIGLETLLRLSQHGDGCYAFIPKDIVDCFHLLPGDRVQVKLVASYRLLSGEEQEETEDIREERIELTLVKPKERRRRRKPDLDSDSEFQESTESEDESQSTEPTEVSEEENLQDGEL